MMEFNRVFLGNKVSEVIFLHLVSWYYFLENSETGIYVSRSNECRVVCF